MSKSDTKERLRHMLENAQKARELARGLKRADLDKDWVQTYALVRALEVIGEAANHIPVREQIKYSEIPWSEIVGLRHRLIHGYDSVDLDILWQIVKQDLSPLIRALRAIVK